MCFTCFISRGLKYSLRDLAWATQEACVIARNQQIHISLPNHKTSENKKLNKSRCNTEDLSLEYSLQGA